MSKNQPKSTRNDTKEFDKEVIIDKILTYGREESRYASLFRNHVAQMLDIYPTDLECLEYLDISENEFEKLPESISCLNSLQYLDVSDNKLDLIPESVKDLENLSFIKLGNNKLSTLPEALLDLHTYFKYLKYVDFSNNEFSSHTRSKINGMKLRYINIKNS